MILIRVFGWLLIAVASVAASAEAVLALGPGVRPGLATGEVWTLLSGVPASAAAAADHWASVVAATVMMLPAWVALGVLGVALVMLGRLRRRRPRGGGFG